VAVSAVERIERVSLTAADSVGTEEFYVGVLGFRRIAVEMRSGPAFARLMGLEDARARVAVLGLGEQTVEIVAFERPGMPYPANGAGNDPWFQHMAIVVPDMRAACAHLAANAHWTPISAAGPERLPASSGGVTAFKFRDPEGHPLEFLEFPSAGTPPVWQRAQRSDLCLGIDHSAIVVADTATSIGFYGRLLGFSVASTSLNRGIEQARLDGVPDAVVDVTGLEPGTAAPPHLELLCYQGRTAGYHARVSLRSNDVAATRLVLGVRDVTESVKALASANAHVIACEAGALGDGRVAALACDPDGHHLLLRG
jgi:catechol 2,3-dioxygenase-like lactoylglutathione lyase family enzyme